MRSKKPILVLFGAFIMVLTLKAGDIPFAIINGKVAAHEKYKSITLALDKSRYAEVNLTSIMTVAVLESSKISDGVAETAAVAAGTAAGVSIGANRGQENERKIKGAGLAALVVAGISASAKAIYNWFTQKDPIIIFDAQNGPSNQAIINNLPLGTKVRITLDTN